ncbi:MAG: zinc-dependent metalloprotease [Bdellovibrionales bacterium]|nr:zinc-dependent metalloprotease [Bdellovibrionales bacterium]
MKTQGIKKSVVAIMGVTLAFALGCTKERPFENLQKDLTAEVKDESKALIDTNAEYIYVPSSLNSTRTTDATFPMYMGEAKIVKLQLTENDLKVIEVDHEEQFSENPVNDRPVLSIPIKHVDYRCTPDADGKCTNKEEVDVGKPWAKRKFLKIEAEKLAVQEISFLPVEIKNLFRPCYEEVASGFVGYKLEEDAINIQVEKTYKSNIACAGNIDALSDLTFKVVYHYSLAKLDKVATAGYKAIPYNRKEENTFGFFNTDTLKLDRDNNTTEGSKKTFMNRWNPNSTVVYHMTENFNKPQYAKIKAATIAGIANINHSLKLAGANLQIDLQDAVPGMSPGDLRVNSIVMVEDPVNYGILGYGPTAANPRTGEIVHGRAAMYLGVIKKGIQRAYEEIVLEKLSQSSNITVALTPELLSANKPALTLTASEFKSKKAGSHVASTAKTLAAAAKSKAGRSVGKDISVPVNVNKLRTDTLRREERRLTLRDAVMLKDDESIREQVLSTHCFYDIDNFNMHDSLENEIDKLIADIGTKRWMQLTDAEKDKVIDTLLPFVWVPTLIHEVGHTLGLRHNFAGSEDKVNFYTEKELSDMGISRQFDYSSVMDYGYKSTNELQIMGKYDIAALRFGYAEKILLADDKTLVSIEDYRKDPNLKIKAFAYCTDEHVAVNPNCNRFDEGTNLVEQAQHWMKMYEESYSRRNFRNGAYSFSLYDDATQIRRVGLIMHSLRTVFERYEDIKQTYSLPDDSPVWEQYDFLKDLKAATQLAGNFFMQVIETPDTLCAVSQTKNPNLIVAVVPLRLLSSNAITCFDSANVQINPAYVVVGEAGKSFQSRKDPHSGNPYVDQIDVRGIWIDKMLATNALIGRITGIESFDEFTGNFLDISDLRESLQARLSAVLLDEAVSQIAIRTQSGQVLLAQVPVQFYNATEVMNGHKIMKPLHPGVQKLFGIPNSGMDFQAKLVNVLQSTLPSHEQLNDATSLLSSITINAGLPIGSTPTDYIQTDLGLNRYFANLQSEVASIEVMSREIVILFTNIGEEALVKILDDLEAGKPIPVDATPSEKLARELGAEVITKYLSGGFQDKGFYEKMIQAMAL